MYKHKNDRDRNWNGASSYIGCRYLEKYPYIFVRVAYNYLVLKLCNSATPPPHRRVCRTYRWGLNLKFFTRSHSNYAWIIHIFSLVIDDNTHIIGLYDTIRTSQSCLQAGPDEAPKKVSKKFFLQILIHMFVNSATSKIPPTCHRLLTALMFENIQWMFNGKPPVSYWLIFYASLLTISPLCIFFHSQAMSTYRLQICSVLMKLLVDLDCVYGKGGKVGGKRSSHHENKKKSSWEK